MKKTGNRAIAMLLACLQLVLLFTFALPQAKAEDDTNPRSTEQPVLNKTIRGTVQFSSFNFPSGVPEAGKEGADYVVPFIYSDDYFAKPSFSENASRAKQQNWNNLEEKSLATVSLHFALSCFGTNESIVSADYSNYAKNGLQFLRSCDFSDNILVNDEFCAIPTTDSVGVIIGSKDITVWNNEQQKNESCKLIAIGVRGGGYGAEWASNLTLGGSGVHAGFRTAANKVRDALNTYMGGLDLDDDTHVKYWVVGYSRAGAVANLVAGDLTVKNGVDKKDIYGYTFEAAAGATMVQAENEPVDAGENTQYPNIHNIINKMDAVPRVSISQFKHNRLGVDYVLPYRLNAADLNESYYQRMYSILRTIALGYYDTQGRVIADPVLTHASPAEYPYKDPIRTYYLSLNDVATNSETKGLMEYWDKHLVGTTFWGISVTMASDGVWKGGLLPDASWKDLGSRIRPGLGSAQSTNNSVIFLDQFLDHLVFDLFSNQAWDYSPSQQKVDGHTTGDQLQHRQNYVNNGEQDALRHLVGLALSKPGAKMTELFDKFGDIIGSVAVDIAAVVTNLVQYGGIDDEKNAEDLSKDFRRIIVKLLDQVPIFAPNAGESKYSMPNRTGIGSTEYNISQTTGRAVEAVAPIFTRMYLYDREKYGSQYVGTLMKYLNTILVTHEPEVSTSWLVAMDDNYTSDYRKITLPLNTDIKMYEFRGAYFNNENLDFDANANVVAEFKNGEKISSLDGRIDWETGTDTITVWYPGNLDIRFDVKALAPVTVRSANANLSDYEPAVDSNNIQGANLKVVDYTSNRKPNGNVPDTVSLTRNLKAETNNVPTAVNVNDFLASSSIPLQTGETLQILARGGSNSLDGSSDAVYTIRKSAIKIAVFGTSQTVATNVLEKGTMTGEGGSFAVNGSNELTFTPSVSGTDYSAFSSLTGTTYRFVGDSKRITAQSRVDVIPATNIYYDDPAQGVVTDPGKTTTLVSTIVDGKVDQTTTQDIKFYGTGIDAYCICDESAGYVKAELLDAQGNAIDSVRPMVMNNYYTGTLYNVPTIHFDVPGETAGTFILRLSASFGKSYKLDGVRVFNESHEDPVEAKLAQVDEGEATYVNVRDILLGKDAASALKDLAYTEGAVYFTGDAERQSPADYETIGPKRELYLTQSGQGIAFNVSNPDEVNIAIGLRAADNNAASVMLNGQSKDVTGFDTYYSVTPIDGNVSIEHGSGMVAVTYIKITAKTEVVESGRMLTEAVGPQRIRSSARLLAFVNEPIVEPTESPVVETSPEPTNSPTPTPTISDVVKQMLSRFVNQLFDSISRLFGGW